MIMKTESENVSSRNRASGSVASLTMFLSLCCFACLLFCEAAPALPDSEAVFKKIAMREARIRDLVCISEIWYESETYRGVKTPRDKPSSIYEERFADGFRQRYVDSQKQLFDRNRQIWIPFHSAWSTPGDRLYGFNYTENSGHITTLTNHDLSAYQLLQLLGHTCSRFRPGRLSEIPRIADWYTVSKEVELINGWKCRRIEYFVHAKPARPRKDRVWVCPEKEYLPIRIEMLFHGDTFVLKRYDILEVSEPVPGVYLPSKARILTNSFSGATPRLKPGTDPRDMRALPYEKQNTIIEGWDIANSYTQEWRCKEYRVNQGLKIEDFIIDFPKGSSVSDEFANRATGKESGAQEAPLKWRTP
jgi:hypothetical protein